MQKAQPVTPGRDALQRLIDGVQTLIREHMALARAELKEDLRGMGRDLLAGAAGLPALAAGYLLLMVAIGYLFALWLPAWAAFGIVAVANLATGAAITYAGVRKVMAKRVDLQRTADELQRDKQWLSTMKNGRPAQLDGQLPPRPPTAAVEPPQPASH
jgi:uncharacterized membrane protein YqjE